MIGRVSRTAVAAVLIGLTGAAAAGPAAAQDGALEMRVGGSHALPPAGVQAEGTSYLGAGLLARTPMGGGDGWLWAALNGAASLDGTGGSWLSLAAGAEREWALGDAVSVGLSGDARAFTVGGSVPYRAVAGKVVPGLAWSPGAVELFVEGLFGAGRSAVEMTTSDGGPGGSTRTVEETSELWRTGGSGGVRTTVRDVVLEARVGGWESSAGAFRRVGAAVAGGGRVSWRAEAAVWNAPGGSEVTGSVSLRLPLGGSWTGQASGGRSEPNPLLGTRPGVHLGLSVRRTLARFGDEEEVPLYRVLEDGSPPSVRFALEAPDAERVELTGDFTGWEPVAMRPTDGRWVVEMPVRPGVHHFGFRVDGRWHVPPDAPGRVDDEWGRVNATLVVSR